MKTYHKNKAGTIFEHDSETGTFEPLQFLLHVGVDYGLENKTQPVTVADEDVLEVVPVKLVTTTPSKSTPKIISVTKDNWQDFELLGSDAIKSLSEVSRKQYKRQYGKYWYYKQKSKGSKPTPKPKSEPKPENKKAPSGKGDVAALSHQDDRIPKDLIQTYGFTAVKAIMEAKNKGIGYTSDEIYHDGLPVGCGHLLPFHVQEIVDGLEAVNL